MFFEVAVACVLTLLFYCLLKKTVVEWYEDYMEAEEERQEMKDPSKKEEDQEQEKEQGGKR